MADFPQYDWKILDNTTIPFTKPQHYKKGSTTEVELTGHDNPLPVANYTQNDSGMWMPVSKSNPVPTQVTGSNVEQFTFFDRDIRTETTGSSSFTADDNATGLVVVTRIYGIAGDVSNGGVSFRVSSRFFTNILTIDTEKHTREGLNYITLGYGGGLGDAKGYYDSIKFYRTDIKILPGITYRCLIDIDG